MSHARSEYEDFKRLAPDASTSCWGWASLRPRRASTSSSSNWSSCAPRRSMAAPSACSIIILLSERIGVPVDKLNLVAVWREAPIFSARERAALAWTEALTFLPDGVSDEVYAQATREFSEMELMYLTSAVASINVWNRFGAAYRWTPAEAAGRGECCGILTA